MVAWSQIIYKCMRREQFNQKHNGLAKEQQDMKWRVYQDELLYEGRRPSPGQWPEGSEEEVLQLITMS